MSSRLVQSGVRVTLGRGVVNIDWPPDEIICEVLGFQPASPRVPALP